MSTFVKATLQGPFFIDKPVAGGIEIAYRQFEAYYDPAEIPEEDENPGVAIPWMTQEQLLANYPVEDAVSIVECAEQPSARQNLYLARLPDGTPIYCVLEHFGEVPSVVAILQ